MLCGAGAGPDASQSMDFWMFWGSPHLRAVAVFLGGAAPWPLGCVSKAAGGPFGRVLGTLPGLDVDAASGM